MGLTGYAAALLLGGHRAAVVQLLVGAVAVASAYATDWSAPRTTAALAGLFYLGFEAAAGRLVHDEYWLHLAGLSFLVLAVLGAASARATRERDRAAGEQALARVAAAAGDARIDELLGAERPGSEIERELIRSRRHGHEASVLVIRPDGLEDLGLRHGAEGIETVLAAVAAAIAGAVRVTDVGRTAQTNDLHVLLPETPAEGARVAAERIRLATSRLRLTLAPGDPVDLTVSIGVAAFPLDSSSEEELLDAAAGALARAVELGGNRTVLTTVPVNAPPGWGGAPQAPGAG